jgi:hypothetical protein
VLGWIELMGASGKSRDEAENLGIFEVSRYEPD